MSSCSSCLCSFIFTGPARICDVTMSHTWIYSWCKIKVVFFNFFIYFCTFRSFRWFRFGRFACFGGFFSLISLVSVVSFRPFRFVVSGFRTCRNRRRRAGYQGMTWHDVTVGLAESWKKMAMARDENKVFVLVST